MLVLKYGCIGSHEEQGRLSLVCKQFNETLKPLLFGDVTLRSPSDISRLLNILISNGTLLRGCPQTIALRNNGGLLPKFSMDIRARLGRCHCLTFLQLNRCTIWSFSALLRLLATFPLLENVALSELQSKVPFSETSETPDCNGGFKRLREVSCAGTDGAWAISWMLAASATGWTFHRKRTPRDGDVAEPIPPDTCAIVKIFRIFYVHFGDRFNGWMYKFQDGGNLSYFLFVCVNK